MIPSRRIVGAALIALFAGICILGSRGSSAGRPAAEAQKAVEVEYKNLLPHQFAARFKEAPLAYVPVGSLEWHGEHLCLGNDGVKAEALCKEAARRGGGIVLPCAFLGIPGMTGWGKKYDLGNRGIFSIEPELLRRILLAQLENLDRLGFRGAIVITGHYPREQIDLVKQVAAEFKPQRGMKVAGITDAHLARSVGHTGDHAAKWETSILLALHPELADLSQLPRDPKERLEGVSGGDPRTEASAELGRKVVDAMAKELCDLGKSLLGK